jgi:hypothetical protein
MTLEKTKKIINKMWNYKVCDNLDPHEYNFNLKHIQMILTNFERNLKRRKKVSQ